jgi:hypothetical protein
MDPAWPTRTIYRLTQTDGVLVIKVSKVNALCASIALAICSSVYRFFMSALARVTDST